MDCASVIPVVSAIGTLALGTAGVWIGLTQHRLAKAKAQHDLYDKRIEIYTRFRDLLVSAHIGTAPDDLTVNALHKVVDGADFLFSRDFGERLRRLCISGREWHRYHHRALKHRNNALREKDWRLEDEQRNEFDRLAKALQYDFVKAMKVKF